MKLRVLTYIVGRGWSEKTKDVAPVHPVAKLMARKFGGEEIIGIEIETASHRRVSYRKRKPYAGAKGYPFTSPEGSANLHTGQNQR